MSSTSIGRVDRNKRIRLAVRALVIDHDDRVLLVKYESPIGGPEMPLSVVWGVPGGGIDDGESEFEALGRELNEELGLRSKEFGPPLWRRTVSLTSLDPNWDLQSDMTYLLRVNNFEPQPGIGWKQMNAEYVTELRWWSHSELAAAIDVRFAPEILADLVGDLIANGPPEVPPELQLEA